MSARLLKLLWLPLSLLSHLIGQPTGTTLGAPTDRMMWQVVFLLLLLLH
jgi:hypothetical protein